MIHFTTFLETLDFTEIFIRRRLRWGQKKNEVKSISTNQTFSYKSANSDVYVQNSIGIANSEIHMIHIKKSLLTETPKSLVEILPWSLLPRSFSGDWALWNSTWEHMSVARFILFHLGVLWKHALGEDRWQKCRIDGDRDEITGAFHSSHLKRLLNTRCPLQRSFLPVWSSQGELPADNHRYQYWQPSSKDLSEELYRMLWKICVNSYNCTFAITLSCIIDLQ